MSELQQMMGDLLGRGLLLALEIGVAAGLAAAAFAYYLRWKSPEARARRAAMGRFRRLADAHGLAPQDRRILRRMAELSELEDPALIFVRRSCFESTAPSIDFDVARIEPLKRQLYE